MDERTIAKDKIKSHWREIMAAWTGPAKQNVNGETSFICPNCQHGRNGDGLAENKKANSPGSLHCFGCNFSGDIIDLWQKVNPSRDYDNTLYDLAGLAGIYIDLPEKGNKRLDRNDTKETDWMPKEERPKVEPQKQQGEGNQQPPKTEAQKQQKAEAQEGKFLDKITRARAAVEGAKDYLHSRGFKDWTIEAYQLGYEAKQPFWKKDKDGKKVQVYEPALIIPYDEKGSYYIARNLEPEKEDRAFYKPSGISEPLYNAPALSSGYPCFICEGQLNALSIAQVQGLAIALGGGGRTALLEALDRERPKAPLILCFDNDPQGRKNTAEVSAELRKRNIPFSTASFLEDVKDVNEYLQKYGDDRLAAAVKWEVDNAPQGIAAVNSFMREVFTDKYAPVKTGLPSIDNLLNGGFIRQSLVLLGAQPGAGKTCLAAQIFESLAKQGHSCIYFNLEMSRQQLLARSLSRICFTHPDIKKGGRGWKFTSLDILRAYRANDIEQEVIKTAGDIYKREIAPRLLYNPDTGNDLDSIIKYAEAAAVDAEARGEAAPNICIDYLHLVQVPGITDPGEVIKTSVAALKEYAVKHNAIVLAIIAHNRAANASSKPTLGSGRDSSALEYSADLYLALTAQGEPQQPQPVRLTVLKSRFTAAGKEVDYAFYGGQSYLDDSKVDFAELEPEDSERL